MKKKTTKKALQLSTETLRDLENKNAVADGQAEGTTASHIGCCP